MPGPRLNLRREQVLAHRRRVGGLDEKSRLSADSLQRAAWAGLCDSMPRAALLSLHARISTVGPGALEHPTLAQVWGPRFNAYVVAERDHAVFTLGRLPLDEKGARRAHDTAARVNEVLAGRRLPYGQVGRELGVTPNALRYATTTGTVRIHWDGARQPIVWTIDPPTISAQDARTELLRRYLHVLGPGDPAGLARWAGIKARDAVAAFAALAAELSEVRTPLGEAMILASDEQSLRAGPQSTAPARLLPSGDAYFLCWGAQRALLVPEAGLRDQLWTPRVWPGAILAGGEVIGFWRRAESRVSLTAWRRVPARTRSAVEAEAASMHLPGLSGPITIEWTD